MLFAFALAVVSLVFIGLCGSRIWRELASWPIPRVRLVLSGLTAWLVVLGFAAFLVASPRLARAGVNYYNTFVAKSFGIGAGPARLTQMHYGCDATSDAAAGAWSSRATSTSSSASFTLANVAVGDSCQYVPGAAVGASNQAVVWTCQVTGSNTVRERVTNASGGSITPTTGQHCALSFHAQ